MSLKHRSLAELKNLGAASVNILQAVGVNNYQELQEIGPVATYCRIKARGIHVSKVMLYALQGALLDQHWNDLDIDLKKRLVEESEQQPTAESA